MPLHFGPPEGIRHDIGKPFSVDISRDCGIMQQSVSIIYPQFNPQYSELLNKSIDFLKNRSFILYIHYMLFVTGNQYCFHKTAY